jgi:ZIP family zinc transporter
VEEEGAGPWAIYFGVAVDLFSDGLMIGTGATISFGLGLLLALGQVSADLPEGFATIAAFKRRGVARRTRLLIAAAFAVPVFLGATIGFWAVRDAPEIVKLAVLAFTAGILLTVVIEEIVPEAHEGEEARAAALFLVGGFALFTLIAAYIGG